MNTSRRNARGEASLQRILESTVQLVSRYGYDNTTIARIVRATERPASSIYWFFENKDELITAALENSYARVAPSRRSWEEFNPDRPLLDQLRDELEPELRASESEDPLRLGIMLALEGSAANSKIQEPFQRRRAGAQRRIEAWWDAAFVAQETYKGLDRTAGIGWMGRLTMAFLDGHYISDVAVEDRDAAGRSTIVAHALAGAFGVVSDHTGQLSLEKEPYVPLPAKPPSPETGPEVVNLLRVTRALVAEHGYEGATMSRICEASGMQRSSVYWRYKDKDTLIRAAVAEPFLDLLTPLRQLPVMSEHWREELSSALSTVMRHAHAQPDTVKGGLLLKLQRWDPPTSGGSAVLAGAASAEAQLAGWFENVLPPAGQKDPISEHLAWIVTRLCEGLMLGSALGHPVPSDSVAGILVPMLAEAFEHWQTPVSGTA